MDSVSKLISSGVYENLDLKISKFELELESKEYTASRFEINGKRIICRNAKITPKKVGQFVTFWKRIDNGPIEPFSDSDEFSFYVVNVRCEDKFGQFVFPKSVLIKRGIISTESREGKRGFRVYPAWDVTESGQAKRTQKWQLDYFYEIDGITVDLERVSGLYEAQ